MLYRLLLGRNHDENCPWGGISIFGPSISMFPDSRNILWMKGSLGLGSFG